jgi:hypothetical protein
MSHNSPRNSGAAEQQLPTHQLESHFSLFLAYFDLSYKNTMQRTVE